MNAAESAINDSYCNAIVLSTVPNALSEAVTKAWSGASGYAGS